MISALSESRIMVKFDLAKVLFLDLLTKYTDYHLPVVARNEKYNGKSENLVIQLIIAPVTFTSIRRIFVLQEQCDILIFLAKYREPIISAINLSLSTWVLHATKN